MKSKSVLKSKAMWSGVLLFVGGVCKLAAEYLTTGAFDMAAFMAMFTGTGLIGVRAAQD